MCLSVCLQLVSVVFQKEANGVGIDPSSETDCVSQLSDFWSWMTLDCESMFSDLLLCVCFFRLNQVRRWSCLTGLLMSYTCDKLEQ